VNLDGLDGGDYYWFPKMFGKMYSEAGARLSFIFTFIGFNVTFFPQFILGANGMPVGMPTIFQLLRILIKFRPWVLVDCGWFFDLSLCDCDRIASWSKSSG